MTTADLEQHTHKATLRRGSTYFMGTRRFDRGVPVEVTGEEKEYLEQSAFDLVSVEGEGNVERAKFSFEEISEDAEVEDATPAAPARAPAPRQRAAVAPTRGRRVPAE